LKALTILIRNDFLRKLRSPVATLGLMAFPLVMTSLIGVVVSNASSNDFPPIPVLVASDDDGLIGRFILSSVGNEEMRKRFDARAVDSDEGRRLMEEGAASALIVVPAGFTEGVFDGREQEIELIKNPAESIRPEIVEKLADAGTLLLSLAAEFFQEELAVMRRIDGSETFPADMLVAALSIDINKKLRKMEKYVFPPVVDLAAKKEKEKDDSDDSDESPFNPFSIIFPGIMLMSILFLADLFMRDIYRDSKSGALTRIMVTPPGAVLVVSAKMTAAVLFVLVTLVATAVVAALLGWLEGMGNPAGVVLLALGFSLVAVGLATLVYCLARTLRQATAASPVLILALCMAGGSMIPVSAMGEAFLAVARCTPNYWAIEGYIELMAGKSLADIGTNLAVLFGMAAVACVLGALQFKRRFGGGG